MKLTRKTAWTVTISLAAALVAAGAGTLIWWTHH